VAELALQLPGDPAQAVLVVADLATATSAPMRALSALYASNGASMKSMALLVLAEAASEADMQACISAGAVDMVLPAYALEHLGALAGKHINARGELRVNLNNKVVAIDSQGAMARIQSDQPFFGSLLRAFFDELPQRRQLLREAWSQDRDQVHHRSHALKGLAATLGLDSLEQVARQAEERVQQPGQGAAEDAGLLLQLEGEMQSARFQILRWLALHPDAAVVKP
jgi:HPt (histidine-containing phosphotransfer) domain-containing protein